MHVMFVCKKSGGVIVVRSVEMWYSLLVEDSGQKDLLSFERGFEPGGRS